MGRIPLIIGFLSVFIFPGSHWAAESTIPKGIAGVELNQMVDECKARLREDSNLAVRFQGYLEEVELEPVAGIKTGLVAYGTCAELGRIVRIKIKYTNGSKGFFDELLKRFKARFGNPNEWRGDPFHVMIAWKWAFVDDQGNRISLTLQHNAQDHDKKMGNALKLNLSNGIEKERACYLAKAGGTSPAVSKSEDLDWDLLVPR
jgi:hypothetical protein